MRPHHDEGSADVTIAHPTWTGGRWRGAPCFAALLIAACSGSGDGAEPPAPTPVPSVQCDRAATLCPQITIAGDPIASTPTFNGYADAALVADPRVPNRFWMAYTYLEGRSAVSTGGQPVGVPHTATHLAQSTDGGSTWSRSAVLRDSALTADPEGLGPASYFGSETPSLAAVAEGNTVRWYAARLSYFLEPVSAYQPRFASSWTIRVSTATGDTPAVLAQAPEALLGVGTTAAVYGPTARLNTLSPALAGCGFWNNPAVALEGGRLFVLAECMEFDGSVVSDLRSRVVVFSTLPTGSPAGWNWRYDGVLADRAVATELGASRVVSANVSRTEDGRRMLLLSLHAGGNAVVNQGCVGVKLAGLAPPALARTNGQLTLLARLGNETQPDWYTGACAHEAGANTGIVAAAAVNSSGLQSTLVASRLRP
jgi:hypothetical protein